MLYPLTPCETQPLITIANVTLRNVQHTESLTPGVIRCHETNPCTGFEWNMVNGSGWWHFLGFNYITSNVQGEVIDSKPIPAFGSSTDLNSETYGADLGEVYGEMMRSFIRSLLDQDKATNFKTAVKSFSRVYKGFTQ